MGNHIVCCRQKWSQLCESEERITADFARPSLSYNNPAASFNGDVWRTCSAVQLSRGGVELNTFSNEQHIPSVNKTGVTQHIGEREPEDTEFDPSLNASRHALFISGFQQDHKATEECNHPENVTTTPGPTCSRSNNAQTTPLAKRWSSCSTIYIGDSCLVHPNQKSTLWSVSIAVSLLIRSEKNNRLTDPVRAVSVQPSLKPQTPSLAAVSIYEDVYSLFDERVHTIERYPSHGPGDSAQPDLNKPPKAPEVHQFLCRLFNTALLGPECAIVALIFLERLVNAAEVGLVSWSWRRQLLACILLASKVLDDQAVWNTDYCQILRDVCVDDLNALERHTLSLLQFNIDVPPAVYARYYFDLLYVAQASGVANQPSERRRLTAELAQQLRLLPSRTAEAYRSNAGMLFDLPHVDSSARFKSRDPDAKAPKRSKKPTTTSSGQKITNGESLDPRANKGVSSPRSKPAVVSSSSVASTSKPTTDAYFHSEIMFTLEPVPPAHSPGTDDEGPLQLDDETELINTLTESSLIAPPLNEVQPTSRSDHPTLTTNPTASAHACVNPYTRFGGDSWRCPPCTTTSGYTTAPSELLPVRWTTISHHHHQPSSCDTAAVGTTSDDSRSIGSGFIRTLMGGDVAYSLLRDAGMY